ncbi:MAG: AAA family ATPase, partial [Ramlibacter sp.]
MIQSHPPGQVSLPDQVPELAEREAVLRQLHEALLRAVRTCTGHTVFVSGEAGIGKTRVLNALADLRGNATLWWGACDALETPHPLAPLQDIARSRDVRFRALLGPDAARPTLFEGVLSELQHGGPTLLVIEDLHWADEATLDLIRFLGRRIDRAPCLLAITYRDDELTPAHPVRRLLGELPSSLVSRIELPRLSPQAVELLAQRASQPAAGIYSATHGNPFYVTELLRNRPDSVPRSVEALVMARFARLSTGAQDIARMVSIVPAKIERWLVDKLLTADVILIEECLNSGLLGTAPSALCFRHELARVAVEGSLSEPVQHALHARVLGVLVDEEKAISLARLVHHATHAGDVEAVLRYAPQAAAQAQQRGAHREAAAHYRTVLQHAAGRADVEHERVHWLEAYARECQLTDQLEEAIGARLELSKLHRLARDRVHEAANLSQLALLYVPVLRKDDAAAASEHAIELLEAFPPSAELANAYRVEAQLQMLDRHCEASVAWGDKALRLAREIGDREVIAAAISTLGAATMFIDYDAGHGHLQTALALALRDQLHYVAANTYNHLGAGCGELFRLGEARGYMIEAISFADRNDIAVYRNYCISWLAMCDLHLGDWEAANERALDVIQQVATCSTSRLMALVVLGRVRARRGEPGVQEVLDEALQLALSGDTLQLLAPVRAARAEAAWLRGDAAATANEAGSALELAVSQHHPWFIGELSYWMRRAGLSHAPCGSCAEPFALEVQGQWREAARAWERLGCPYEQARALGDGDAPAQVEALKLFEQLGARPGAEIVRRHWRAAGRRGLPRGMRPSTQVNPHQLTVREVEVLELLREGLKNSEIAERLFRSVRTVDHHL